MTYCLRPYPVGVRVRGREEGGTSVDAPGSYARTAVYHPRERASDYRLFKGDTFPTVALQHAGLYRYLHV